MQSPCLGCVAGAHLLLGNRFGAELLEDLAAIGELLLGFPDPVAELSFGGRLDLGAGALPGGV